jgi:hypothetical protein
MSLDNVNELPVQVNRKDPGHRENHGIIHAALKQADQLFDSINETTEELTGLTAQAVNGQYTAAANASRMINKLKRGVDSVVVLYVGDSTGNENLEHIYLEAQALGAMYPNYTVEYKMWNDTTRVYENSIVIQTGNVA